MNQRRGCRSRKLKTWCTGSRTSEKQLGITVIMVEHDMSLVSQVSDHVLAINQGRFLASGSVQEVQADPAVIEAYLGSDAAQRMKEMA